MIKYIFLALCFLTQLSAKDCRSILSRVERVYGLPEGILHAIAQVESRCHPYAVSAGGRSHYFSSLPEAAQFVMRLGARKRNLNVGCMQLNFSSHRHSFADTYEMVHPELNIIHAAKMIIRFYSKYGSWERAVRTYNCGNPHGAKKYWKKVQRAWKTNVI